MPVAQLVHHFESMDHPIGASSRGRSFSRKSFSSRRFSLRAMFRHHARTSSSSSEARSFSSVASPSSPSFSASSSEHLPVPSAYMSISTGQRFDHSTTLTPPSEFPELRRKKAMRPVKVQRTFSSTSDALQSEFTVDQLHLPGVDLFEPRPHGVWHQKQATLDPIILDGIMQVMESG